MEKTLLALSIICIINPISAFGKERVVIYDNYGYLFSKKTEIVSDNYLLEIPNSVDNSSLDINFIYNKKPLSIIDKTIQNNSIKTLYYQNIDKNIKFKIGDKEIEGELLSISNNFIKIKENMEEFYYNINHIHGVKFEKDFNFSNKVFDINLKNNKKREVEVSYSAKFNQISWNPTYRFLINEKDDYGYFDYDITIDNSSSYHFKNIGLELLSGNINQPINNRRSNKMAYSEVISMDSSSKSFQNFAGYQKLTFDYNINLEPFSSATYPYFEDKKLKYERKLILNDNPRSEFNNSNPKIKINIPRINEEDKFPLMSGAISVFNGDSLFESTFIGGSNISVKSKSENIEFFIGDSQNVFVSKKVDTKSMKYYDPLKNNTQNRNNSIFINKVTLLITNDELRDIELVYKLNQHSFILSEKEYQSAGSIENVIEKYKTSEREHKTFNIKKESSSQLNFIIVEV
jgi:hypothetical protein